MTTSYSSLPPSYDPALDLHSEDEDEHPPLPPSDTFSDDLEALNQHRLEQVRSGVVIRHRAWQLSDVFRSDEDTTPNTPTRTRAGRLRSQLAVIPSSPPSTTADTVADSGAGADTAKMPFMSSPVAYPSSAPEQAEQQKRKHDADAGGGESQPAEPQKRQKVMGGFLDDDGDEGDDSALQDAQMMSQFEIQEDLIGQNGTADMPLPPSLRMTQLSQETRSAPVESVDANDTLAESTIPPRKQARVIHIKTCSGRTHYTSQKTARAPVPYERLVAERSTTAPGKATRSYYGIEIHKLLDEAAKEEQSTSKPPPDTVQPTIEPHTEDRKSKKLAGAMWTEKYRARKFTDLIGDERTHRSVLRWLKGWDPIVFPGIARSKGQRAGQQDDGERPHRKVMLLSGPPGLGKTTLAHVCARQAGYEVLEINASDERSRDVVKGRIRDALGTENVKGVNVEVGESKVRKVGRPVCVVVDEVDGVVSGSSGGGEGGFMKALIDLVLLDQKNSTRSEGNNGKKRKGDNFRFLRPLILVCNDLYHPSLRPLRSSTIAEMIHVRQAPLENVVSRVKNVFAQEGIPSDADGVRKLCEASWGLGGRKQGKSSGAAEGDIRSVLVGAEWVAHKFRNEGATSKLTKNWLERRILSSGGGTFFKGLNRGSVRDIVDRVFAEGAGFGDVPMGMNTSDDHLYDGSTDASVGIGDIRKRHAISRLREMVDASGDHDRCMTDCFSSYPSQTFQDDTFLSKPNAAYDWLHFHDSISSKVYSAQDWELTPYLSQSVLAFHNLFASVHGKRRAPEKNEDDPESEHPFAGPRADFAAFEALKHNRSVITGLQSSFSPPLARLFRSTDSLVTDLIPNLIRMLSPDVKPVVVRGGADKRSVASVRKDSERALIQSAVRVMTGLGVTFEKVRVENEGAHGGWVYRMEPPLDSLVTFSKTNGSPVSSLGGSAPVRYAVRQVLDQEYRKETTVRKQSDALKLKQVDKSNDSKGKKDTSSPTSKDIKNGPLVKRDFFGRVIREPTPPPTDSEESSKANNEASKAGRKAWVTYHDGYSKAVRKPISMSELLAGL